MKANQAPTNSATELAELPMTRGAVEQSASETTTRRGAYMDELGRKLDIFDEAGNQDYASLRSVFAQAMVQAAEGKGKERHAGLLPFEHQPMLSIAQMQGSELGLVFQAVKKANESKGLPTPERQVAELLGAMNYLAGAVIYIQRNRVSDGDDLL